MSTQEKLKMFRECAKDIVTLPVRFVKYVHDVKEEANRQDKKRLGDDYDKTLSRFDKLLNSPKGLAGVMTIAMGTVGIAAGSFVDGFFLSSAFAYAVGGVGFSTGTLKTIEYSLKKMGDDPDQEGKEGLPAPIKILPSQHKNQP